MNLAFIKKKKIPGCRHNLNLLASFADVQRGALLLGQTNYLRLCQQNSNSVAAACHHSVTKMLSPLLCAAFMPSIFIYSLWLRARCA